MGVLNEVFRAYGLLCAQHPWQVIFVVLTSTVCIISEGMHLNKNASGPVTSQTQALDIVLMTLVRAVAVLYSYQRLRSLHRSHSRIVLSLAGLFIVFSSFVFTCSVVNFMQSDLSDLKDALFFFLLLIDVVKACTLAKWTLSCSVNSSDEVGACISQGMAVLGPAITLDTLVETLVIGIGTLSGVERLEVLCGYGCMSAVVNYLVFMTFYPACLALVLELSDRKPEPAPMSDESYSSSQENVVAKAKYDAPSQWQQQVKVLKQMMALDQPNPVVQQVKVIMAAGLMVVHAHCRWVFLHENKDGIDDHLDAVLGSGAIHDPVSEDSVLRWLSDQRADQLVLLILVLALTVKFALFDDHTDGEEQTKDLVIESKKQFVRPLPVFKMDTRFLDSSRQKAGISPAVADEPDNLSEDKSIQTDTSELAEHVEEEVPQQPTRNAEESYALLHTNASLVSDQEVLDLIKSRRIATHKLELLMGNMERGVQIRRKALAISQKEDGPNLADALRRIPYRSFDYNKVYGACCENVIGYAQVPLGYAGPLLVDGKSFYVPIATTEGCLVASINRGCSALATGVHTELTADGMTRGPVVRFAGVRRAAQLARWMKDQDNFNILKKSFDATSRFGRLESVKCRIAGRLVFIRFCAQTGDAMGMNMVSKGTEAALGTVKQLFPDMEVVSLSGNFCTDKKPAAVNWLGGRGKSIVCEAIVPAAVLKNKLRTTAAKLEDLNQVKNGIGSAIAGSIGGFNAQAANVVAAIYIACGQDPAQVVEGCNCMTLMETCGPDNEDLHISCTMPAIEVGTVGGGTILPTQGACLDMLGLRGAHPEKAGGNATQLARIVCATVLAGELSLMAALATKQLVESHMRHNRSTASLQSLVTSTAGNKSTPSS